MVVGVTHYDKERRKDELQQQLKDIDGEIDRNKEQLTMLTNEKESIKRELWGFER